MYLPVEVLEEVLRRAEFALLLESSAEVRDVFLILRGNRIAGFLLFTLKKPSQEDLELISELSENLGVQGYAIFRKGKGFIAVDGNGEEIPLEQGELAAFVNIVF
ncbi:hypothetical protein [Thermococcus aciditolerans]|uniref:Uncharacterized protein n=1 Tax=Thermococcus aciditolerans TaxID=2598455 RepID=A0A5C0SKS3_9EURY|nr:hypothetical protein [Thermococcus aciditolerans]QEK14961.1 hypothetical protein FPV09_07510 [Thermococcus aciditolerans]